MNIKKIVELIIHLLISPTSVSKSSLKSLPSKSPIKEDPKLEIIDGYFVWQKEYEYPLSKHFSTREFKCKCSYETCKEQRISVDLINKLEVIREEIGQPLIIISAYRCSRHQEYIRQSGQFTVVAKKSTHELGDAADIVPRDGKDVKGQFLKVCAQHFDSIGLSDKFLHCDQRKGVRRWVY